ncbi:hypothetical protein [Brachyspira hyodysenteriae]|uniref:hypothetical protein n=1 Tax=Brachyspira hyodysenteriae TaxID=159 RepID=UPI00063DC416|nr:hypothetical protein [Brachyspira hyodysenteriae]KLI18768.1 hypothetical protein SU46_07805 [Brachyspira hyodysenteriae]KLI30476.1 hypothetical protein SZ48_12905 [Brachyspira hyodysenteriae]
MKVSKEKKENIKDMENIKELDFYKKLVNENIIQSNIIAKQIRFNKMLLILSNGIWFLYF